MDAKTVVTAAPAAVYELIANPHRRVRWLPELDAAAAPDRPLRHGDRFEGQSSLFGHRFLGSSEVTEARPPLVLEERVVIGARLTSRWTITDRGSDGAEVTHSLVVDYPAGPLGWVARALLRGRLRRMQRQGLEQLARVL